MSSTKDIEDEFRTLNVSVNQNILEKCAELCKNNELQPEDFMDLWLAHAATNSLPMVPTLNNLEQLERTLGKDEPNEIILIQPDPSTSQQVNVNWTEDENVVVETTPVTQHEESFSHLVPSAHFKIRNDAGTVVQVFGASNGETHSRGYLGTVRVKIIKHKFASEIYMYDTYRARVEALSCMSKWTLKGILEHNKLELSKGPIKQYSPDMVICGRIWSENNVRLDQNSLMIATLPELYRGHTIKLNINKVERVRLFPGQNVVACGKNMKDWFVATHLYTGSPMECAPNPVNLTENLQIMVASGPFALQENLVYEPLDALLQQVLSNKPNVLILMGPFLDKQQIEMEKFNENYITFFENIIYGIMDRLKSTETQVVLVPSPRDYHHHNIFPTLPFKLKKSFDNLHLAPNPFFLDVEGVIISGSTADVLFHLSKTEMAKGSFQDRIGQLISHIFSQRNMYPLYPPERDFTVDFELLEQYATLEETPHLMLLPSNLKHFVKNIDNCVVINPEKLTKGNGGGNFVKIEVRPGPLDGKISDRITCTIQRI